MEQMGYESSLNENGMTSLLKKGADFLHKINLADSFAEANGEFKGFDFKGMMIKMVEAKAKAKKSSSTKKTSIVTCDGDDGPNYFKFAMTTKTTFGKNGQSSDKVTLKNRCFQKNTLTFNRTSHNSFEIVIDASDSTSILCEDIYLIATINYFSFEKVFFKGKHVITVKNLNEFQVQNMKDFGVHVYKFCDNTEHLLSDLLMTVKCFLGGLGTNPNIPFFGSKPTHSMEVNSVKFLKNNAGMNWKLRKSNELLSIYENTIKSGTYLSVTRIDGIGNVI